MLHFDKKERTPNIAPNKRQQPTMPDIDPALRLKWGLAMLGKEKAKEYLDWLQTRIDNSR